MTASRETSGATVRLVLGHVRERAGDGAVQAVIDLAGLPYPLEQLDKDSTWIGYDERIRLFEAVVELLGDPDAPFKIGASALAQSVNPALVLMLRALGSPRDVYTQLPRAVPKFTATSTMEIGEVGAGHAVIDYRLHDGYDHSRLDCAYTQGLLGVVPEIFGLPPATIAHERCQSDGHPCCTYVVTWMSRSRWPWRRRAQLQATLDNEVRSLRQQLAALQSAASDLVSGDDLHAVLDRVADRAASAVLAQGYLLTVEDPYGGPPRVHSAGIAQERAARLASKLLAGGDLGPSAVVVDVASARRHHGRLAAIYPDGQRGPANERELLAAYAGHAAAALDTILALEDARRGEDRANALLRLARALVATHSAHDVARVVAAALPDVMGAQRGSILLWDAGEGVLAPIATTGLSEREQQNFARYRITPEASPTLAAILEDPRPRMLRRDTAEPYLRELLQSIGSDRVALMPMLADDRLLGLVTMDCDFDEAGLQFAEMTERLRGVASQAVSALLNAELVATVRRQSLHDPLTALPNRELFAKRAADAAATGAPVGLLFCDLDRFKRVNDTLGHAAGDALLREVAARLGDAVRDGDTVARLSGDEFAVLLPDAADQAQARIVADRILAGLSRPFRVEGRDVLVSASVGVAFDPGGGGPDAEALLRDADEAMYQAKRRGRNQVAELTAPAEHPSPSVLSLEADLAVAVRDDALSVALQPIVGLATGTTVGYEALVRWEHPVRGLLLPDEFVPLAEACGLIVGLDLAVMRRAVEAAAEWHAAGRGLTVAVNLSRPTLADPELPDAVREVLERTGLPARLLHLEVTENAVGGDLEAVEERLSRLAALGVGLSLDDFGAGESSIGWLRRFPVDRVKIDRSFVADIASDPSARALVSGLVALGAALGLDMLAEGVETEDQRRLLTAAGCRYGQGHLFGRPELQARQPSAVLP